MQSYFAPRCNAKQSNVPLFPVAVSVNGWSDGLHRAVSIDVHASESGIIALHVLLL